MDSKTLSGDAPKMLFLFGVLVSVSAGSGVSESARKRRHTREARSKQTFGGTVRHCCGVNDFATSRKEIDMCCRCAGTVGPN